MQNAQNKAENLQVSNEAAIQKEMRSPLSSLRFKVLIGATVLASSFSLGDNLKAQTAEKKLNDPKGGVEVVDQADPLNFVKSNLTKCPQFKTEQEKQAMKEHFDKLMQKMVTPEWKAAVNDILKKTLRTATDLNQRILGSIYAIETFVSYGNFFGNRYDSQVTDETAKLMDKFATQYSLRFHKYVAELDKNLAILKEELAKNKEELAKNKEELAKNKEELAKNKSILIDKLNKTKQYIEGFSAEQIQKDLNLQDLLRRTKEVFESAGEPMSEHMLTLLKYVK